MAGLMPNAQPQPQPATAGGLQPPAQAGPATGGQQPNASPEEQAQYDKFMDNAYKAIYGSKETRNAVLENLKGGDNPVAGLANTAALIVSRVEQSAEDNGVEFAEGVVFNAGVEILEDLTNLAEEAGVHKFSEEEQEAAMFAAMDRYREIKGEGIDPKAAAAELGQLKAAEDSGQLEQMAPGLTEFAARGQKEKPQRGLKR